MYWLVKNFQHELKICEKPLAAVPGVFAHQMRQAAKGVLAALVLVFLALSALPAQAEITAKVSVKDERTHGRIVFRFFKLPPYQVKISDGVLIISFEDSINLNVDKFMAALGGYFSAGRMDPDQKSIRFALARKIKLNTIVAGERLFIDLLPQPWSGLLPSLPQHVIDELSAKIRQKDAERRNLARRQAFENSKKFLKIRVGRYPTFSRLVFDWQEKVGVKVSRNGNTLSIRFDKLIRTDISRLKVDPPRFVAGAKLKLTDDGLEIDLMLKPDTNIRAFREGFAYVVDVSGLLNKEEQAERAKKTAVLAVSEEEKSAASAPDMHQELIEFEAETAPKISTPKATRRPVKPKTVPAEMPEMKKSPMQIATANVSSRDVSPETLVASKILAKNSINKPQVKSQVVRKSAAKQVNKPPMVVTKASKAGGSSVAMKAKPPVMVAKKPKMETVKAPAAKKVPEKIEEILPVKAEANAMPEKMGNGDALVVGTEIAFGNLKLSFPFTQDVPAAVFQRGSSLWMVFDSPRKLDMSSLQERIKKLDRISNINIMQSKNSTAVLLRLERPSLTTVSRDGTGWLLTIGDFIITPTKPIKLVPGDLSNGLSKVTFNIKKPARLHTFEDPEVGDTLAVVTAFGSPQGIVKSQRFVTFATITTAHGIAVQSIVDDLKISVNSGDVVITRDAGLMLSPTEGRGVLHANQVAIDITRPGNINFEAWAQGGPAKFNNRRAQLEFDIASKTEMKHTIAPRMELARLYVGNQLGAEALGTMEILKSIDPKIENDPLFHALRGVANLMMYRLRDARLDLTSHGLQSDKDTKLWLGLLEVAEGNWVQARLNFTHGESSMNNYPEEIKALFRIKAARANIEVNDISNARYQLAAMPKINLKRKFTAEVAFLNGRILELLTRNEAALDYYNEALSYGDRMVESEASFFKTMLEFRLGLIEPSMALDRLESQLIVWRGDETELKVMRELAKLYISQNRYRRGLETMRTATTYYPKEKIGRLIQDDMVALFNELFLGEKLNAMPPIKALSLYYDFRELTPIGRRGDEMIRRLSDMLIAVDLLDQAAEILSHQVEKRLKGAARAQVATKLAMVHLYRRKPGKALTTIRRTRQAILPKLVTRRRALIEARALAELGRAELAISILANLEGRNIEQARANASWIGKDWQNAGEAYERYLGNVWQNDNKLTNDQRVDVLRAAISYALADDRLGNERLRNKFAIKMAASPDAQTFNVLTSSSGGKEAEFRDITKKIASIDTLRGFLEEFRKAELPLSDDKAAVPQS